MCDSSAFRYQSARGGRWGSEPSGISGRGGGGGGGSPAGGRVGGSPSSRAVLGKAYSLHRRSPAPAQLQWRNRLARGTYKTVARGRCRGCEFEPHLEQLLPLLRPHSSNEGLSGDAPRRRTLKEAYIPPEPSCSGSCVTKSPAFLAPALSPHPG